jgi:hypothetical protein
MVVDTSFKITYRAPLITLMKKRRWNAEIEKPSWTAVGLHHKRRHLGKHFTAAGAAEYGYATRSKKYTEQKRRKFGHTLPLVYSGQLRANVLSMPEIRATSKGVKVVLRNSQKANYRNPKGQANPAEELRQVSDREAVGLARAKDREMVRRIRAARGQQTKTIT